MMSLPDTQVVETVIFGEKGLINGLFPGSIVVDLSTIHYLATLRMEEELRAKKVTLYRRPCFRNGSKG